MLLNKTLSALLNKTINNKALLEVLLPLGTVVDTAIWIFTQSPLLSFTPRPEVPRVSIFLAADPLNNNNHNANNSNLNNNNNNNNSNLNSNNNSNLNNNNNVPLEGQPLLGTVVDTANWISTPNHPPSSTLLLAVVLASALALLPSTNPVFNSLV